MKCNLVVVNFNNTSCTKGLINSILNSASFIEEVVVVDNCSHSCERNDLVDFIGNIDTVDVSLVLLDKNSGYFPGLNVGISKLRNKSDFYTIIGNNDLVFNNDFFSCLEKADVLDNVLAISPSILTSDGVYQNPSQAIAPSFFRRFFYNVYYKNYTFGKLIYLLWNKAGLGASSKLSKDNNARPIYIGMGAIYILTPQFFINYIELNYPLFLYGEEAFLSRQINEANGILWYEPSIEVIHLESVATSKLPSKSKYELMKKAHNIYKNFY